MARSTGATRTQAIADYKKEIELHPETTFAYNDLANLYAGQGQWSDAEQTLEAWAKADPANPEPNARLGSLQMVQKQYKDAEASLQSAIALSTEPDQLKVQLGEAQVKAGDTDAGKSDTARADGYER